MTHPDKTIELPKPWYWTDQRLTSQLERELTKNHELYGKDAMTLARRQDNDDVLFLIENKTFAVVHLTWNASRLDSRWPRTELYETWEDLYNNRILADKLNFE